MGTGKEAQRRTASSNNLCVGVKVRVTCYGLFLKREDENKDCWKKLSLESNYETLLLNLNNQDGLDDIEIDDFHSKYLTGKILEVKT